MSKRLHLAYTLFLLLVGLVIVFQVARTGYSYYATPVEERPFRSEYDLLKPTGLYGHGYGVIGAALITIGVVAYSGRKRIRRFSGVGKITYWLEFHIFLCTLGPVLVLFHTAYKFGGLVAISFWSMVAVFLSGIIGRFIYLQIPRSIEGRELSLSEVRGLKTDVAGFIRENFNLDEESYKDLIGSIQKKSETYRKNPLIRYIKKYVDDRNSVRSVKNVLKRNNLPAGECRKLIALFKEDISLNRRIEWLDAMQNMFRYWHVVHLPFALVMLVIMIIHISVAIVFGYRWIF